MARWLSWLERRPVTAEVDGSIPFRVVCILCKTTYTSWGLSSAGRASALQAEGHRFEPCRSHILTKYGGIAQLARAHGSYPWCRWFKSSSRYYDEDCVLKKLVRSLFYANLLVTAYIKQRNNSIKEQLVVI